MAGLMVRLYHEFVDIVEDFLADGEHSVKDNRLILTREELTHALDRQQYATAKKRIEIWSRFHWLDSEEGLTRKRIRVDGKVISALQVDLAVYDRLCSLDEETVNKLFLEFMAICNLLLEQENRWIKDGRIIVKRNLLIRAMDAHPFLSSTEKLAIWKDLRWIDCEPGLTRKRIRCENGTRISAIQIDLPLYKQMETPRASKKRKK